MRQAARIFAAAAVIAAAGLSLAAGWAAVTGFERLTLDALEAQRDAEADAWAEISVDGLQVHLSGAAPSETARFQFLRRVTAVVPARRLHDLTTIAAESGAAEPDYSLQVLRDQQDISLIGLVPIDPDAMPIAGRVEGLAPNAAVTNMLERVERTPPALWRPALDFGLSALSELDQAKLSVRPGEVILSGVVRDQQTLAAMQSDLEGSVPEGVTLSLDLSAPRAVISPFRFRARTSPGAGLELIACTAETEVGAEAMTSRFGADADCQIGLGAPSDAWVEVALAAVDGLEEMTEGEVDLSDMRLHLQGGAGQDRAAFSAIADRIAAALPAPYALSRELPPLPPQVTDEGTPVPPRFAAERVETGGVVLQGDLPTEFLRQTTETFARARFGSDMVTDETRTRVDLPPDWSSRAVAGLEALALLDLGRLEMTEQTVRLTGASTALPVADAARGILAAALPPATRIVLDVEVIEDKRPEAPGVVFPADLCAEQVQLILDRNQIAFLPSESAIEDASLAIVDEIARILKKCPGARFEIAGHTDSQGRESSNLALSQARADSVLAALLDRGVDLVFLSTRGYGETDPIAENDTEEGRAANRRIEFRLIDETADAAAAAAAVGIARDDSDPPVEAVALASDAGADEGSGDEMVDEGSGDEMVDAGSGDGMVDEGSGDEMVDEGSGDEMVEEGSGHDAVTDDDAAATADGSGDAPEAAAAPDRPDTPEGAADAAAAERNTSGNILKRPRPRPQRLPQIQQEN